MPSLEVRFLSHTHNRRVFVDTRRRLAPGVHSDSQSKSNDKPLEVLCRCFYALYIGSCRLGMCSVSLLCVAHLSCTCFLKAHYAFRRFVCVLYFADIKVPVRFAIGF